MKLTHARLWFALGCVGCAKLAGFEDFHGAGGSSAGAENRGSTPGAGGRVGGGGKSGGGGSVQAPSAGASPDAGAPATDAGAGGTSSSSGGRPASRGGASAGGTGPGGDANDSGAPAISTGGDQSGGSGGVSTGGASSGGSATGGSAGGTSGGSASGGVPTATGGGPNTTGCGELIFNGDFSHGRDGWVLDIEDYPTLEQNVHPVVAAAGDVKLGPFGVTPASDNYLGWFGGVPMTTRNNVVMLSQEVTVSSNVDYFEFEGVYRIATEEDAGDPMEYDNFYAELRTIEEDTQLGWQFERLSNRDANDAWAAMTPQLPDGSDMDSLRGRSFYFMLYSRTDGGARTDFWIDSVSLVAVCP